MIQRFKIRRNEKLTSKALKLLKNQNDIVVKNFGIAFDYRIIVIRLSFNYY